MIWTKTMMLRKALALFAVMALLILSLTLAACGARANNAGSSNISTNGATQQTTTTVPDNGIQGADQQVQTAVSAVDGAQNDVNNADSSSNNDDGQQP